MFSGVREPGADFFLRAGYGRFFSEIIVFSPNFKLENYSLLSINYRTCSTRSTIAAFRG